MTSSAVFLALLALFPRLGRLPCVVAHAPRIVAQADAGRELGVPPGLVLVVGLLESQWGCARGSGGCWGAPAHASTPDVAGGVRETVSALDLGWSRCGTWSGALHHFRCGGCRCVVSAGYTPEDAMRLWLRVDP